MVETIPAEFEAREPLREIQLYDLLNGVGNHDAKLLTAAIILSDPNSAFTPQRLVNIFKEKQGEDIHWAPNSSIPLSYCERSLSPIGAVTKVAVEGYRHKPSIAFIASEFGTQFGLAFSGAILDWSLKYPDIPLQRVFGSTVSSGDTRSPKTRYLIYSEILTNPNPEASYVDFAKSLSSYDVDEGLLGHQLRDMEQLGILTIRSKLREYNPAIRIVAPDYKPYHHTVDDLRPDYRLLVVAIDKLHAAGQADTDLNTLLAKCLELDPNANPIDLRRNFETSSHKNSPAQLRAMVEVLDDQEGQLTTISLTIEYETAIAELIERLQGLLSDEDLEAYEKRALEILNNPSEFAQLVAKTVRFSNFINARTEGGINLQGKVKTILKNLGALSVREVQDQLAQSGDVYDRYTVRLILDGLTRRDEVLAETVSPDPYKKNRVKKYQLPEEQKNLQT